MLFISFMGRQMSKLDSLFADRTGVLLIEPVADTLSMEQVETGERCGMRGEILQAN